MEHRQNTGKTNANNYIPPANAHSRFYAGNNIIYTPATSSWTIDKVEVTATTAGYASNFAGGTWDNAISSSSDVIASLSPNNSTSEFKNTSLSNQVRATEVKVYFDNTNYTVSKAAVSNGTLDVDKSTAKVNEVITVTATPNTGYALSEISVKDESDNDIAVDGTTFRMPASHVTVSAVFASVSSGYTINTTTNGKGTISTSPASTAIAGASVTVTTTPNDGYVLYSLTVTDEDSGNVELTENTFTMPSKAVTISAIFYKKASWTAASGTISSGFGTTGESDGTKTYTGTLTDTQSNSWSTSRSAVTSGKYYLNSSLQSGCVQVGKNGWPEHLTISTSAYATKTIKSVSVDCASFSAKHEVAITVGSTPFLTSTATSSWTTVGTKEGTGSASGDITITFTAGSGARALYIKNITIYYDE